MCCNYHYLCSGLLFIFLNILNISLLDFLLTQGVITRTLMTVLFPIRLWMTLVFFTAKTQYPVLNLQESTLSHLYLSSIIYIIFPLYFISSLPLFFSYLFFPLTLKNSYPLSGKQIKDLLFSFQDCLENLHFLLLALKSFLETLPNSH